MNHEVIQDAIGKAQALKPEILYANLDDIAGAVAYAGLLHSRDNVSASFDCLSTSDHFLDGDVYPEVYGPVALSHVGQEIGSPENGTNALKALRVLQDQREKDGYSELFQNTLSVLTDKPLIKELTRKSRFDPETHPEELSDALHSPNDREIPVDFWMTESRMVPSGDLSSLLSEKRGGSGVNLESVVISAIGHIIKLRKSGATGERLLQQIYDAETVYAPLAEIVGFDGVAMALRSEAAKKRLYRAGHKAYIDRAENHLLELASCPEDVHANVTDILGIVSDGHVQTRPVLGEDPSQGIIIGESTVVPRSLEAMLELNDLEPYRAVWRLKTVGSLANKMYKYDIEHPGEGIILPGDTLGITLITPNQAQQGMLFAELISNTYDAHVQDGSGLHLVASASRKWANTPFHVRGRMDDIDETMYYIGPTLDRIPGGHDMVDRRVDQTGFEVMKLTLQYYGLPVEIQVVTEDIREKSRIGHYAHVKHKGNREVDPADLWDIKRRAKQFKVLRPTAQSEKRADALRRDISKVELSMTGLRTYHAMQGALQRV